MPHLTEGFSGMTDELISRLESADGPSRELDAEIAAAIRYFPKNVGFVWKNDLEANCPEVGRVTCVTSLGTGGPHYESPRYTASIDAALTLVPEGWQHGYATIPSGDILRAETHHAQAYVDGSEMQDFTKYFRSEASTPALALAAAALKARGV